MAEESGRAGQRSGMTRSGKLNDGTEGRRVGGNKFLQSFRRYYPVSLGPVRSSGGACTRDCSHKADFNFDQKSTPAKILESARGQGDNDIKSSEVIPLLAAL